MYNPFPLINPKYLDVFRQKGEVAFVLQTYERGRHPLAEIDKPAFLLSHYKREHLAKQHYQAIAHDPARRLWYTSDPAHWEKLQRLADSGDRAYVYVCFKTADAIDRLKASLNNRLRAFIEHKLGWKPGRSTVKMKLECTNGQLSVLLVLGAMKKKVNIEEIETTAGYVL